MLKKSTALRDTLEKNVHYFRAGMQKAGFDVSDGDHPIVPIMLGDANIAQSMSKKLQGKARIRTQISAAHTFEDLDKAIDAFATTKAQLD
jgi:glycine C-acetyltransferase